MVRSLSFHDVRGVMDMRLILEPPLVAVAARSVTAELDTERIEDQFRDGTSFSERLSAARDFHADCAHASRKTCASAMDCSLTDEVCVSTTMPMAHEHSFTEERATYEAIFDAVATGNSEAAQQLMPDYLLEPAWANTIADLRDIARRRVPTAAFEYVDGGSFAEHSLRRNRDAFDAVEFNPHVLRDVAAVDLRTTIAGAQAALPVGIALTGLTRLMHAEGEVAGAQAAASFGIPFSLSTMGTVSIEEVAAEAPDADRWFQLYLWKDRPRSLELIRRAEAAGFGALVVTVDTPVSGARYRDTRNGMTLPPTLTAKTILDASYRPEWWLRGP
ncbi:alpha-hydroxy-acid oxidizing protein [Arthrobacter citreus]|uniref:alpha-hydroxy-acid oxidizing protein n=1 Tax=Arthrobacter citreus TaxID=1670 RepID=UPI0036DF43F7